MKNLVFNFLFSVTSPRGELEKCKMSCLTRFLPRSAKSEIDKRNQRRALNKYSILNLHMI